MRRDYAALLLVLIIAGGVFLRFSNLSWETYSYSEVEIKQAADEYAKGNFVNTYYIFDTPPLPKYVFAAATIIQNSESSLRFVSALFGIMTVIALFFLVKKMYDIKTALLASAITSFSLVYVQFSRYVQQETMLGFFYVMAIYFLWEIYNKKNKYSFLFLGVFLGLALATKFVSFVVVFAIIVYLIYTREIKFSIRPFTVGIQNWILKSLAVTVIVFCLAWPFGFSTLHAETNLSVTFGTEVRSQEISTNVPIMLLSLGRRLFTSSEGIEVYSPILRIPLVNYIVIYFAKESLLFIPLIIFGLYSILKKPKKPDSLILIFTLTFFILLSLHRSNITYRHIAAIVPFLSIIASRWITHISRKWHYAAIALVMGILFLQAFLMSPSYALYYNPLGPALGVVDPESRMSEGMKETLGYINSECPTTYAGPLYRFIGMYYYPGFVKFNESASCVIKGRIASNFEQGNVSGYLSSRDCKIAKTVSKDSVEILDIYKC